MKTVAINIYQFSELSEKAKEYAKDREMEFFGYAWADDSILSLKKFAEHFGGKLKSYSVDFFGGSRSYATFEMPRIVPSQDDDGLTWDEIERRLKALGDFNPETSRGNGYCKLTGFCADEDAIDGFRKAFYYERTEERRKAITLNDLMECAFDSWLKAAQSDCAGQYSDEIFSENSDANGIQYTEDGKIFHG